MCRSSLLEFLEDFQSIEPATSEESIKDLGIAMHRIGPSTTIT